MKAIRITAEDLVAVCLEEIKPGERITVDGIELCAVDAVPPGHKIALFNIKKGENVIKYAHSIGSATIDIPKGSHVHTHNLKCSLGELKTYEYAPNFTFPQATEPLSFRGYRRKDGKVGIRNEIWIIPTVGCAVQSARQIEKLASDLDQSGTDGVYCYTHSYGCSQLGDDQNMTLDLLAGLAKHPNAAGVLILGLGCENAHIGLLKEKLGEYDSDRIKFLVCQDVEDEIQEGLKLVEELLSFAKGFKREPCPSSELIIGLKCGGSDGFSGISANAVIGRVTDKLISQGGSAVLTEVPEMFGAETVLMKRCITRELFEKTVDMINGFKKYFMRYGEKINENPSPGNKLGGISTLEDKSLGCIQKGGKAPVCDVLPYAGTVTKKGLSLMCAPGNDLVSSTALAASGAHLVLFATGRGTPFACPVPTVKISSNTTLAEKKKAWIDFNAGTVLNGNPMDCAAQELFSLIIHVASGEKRAKAEAFDKHELAIFKDGVTL